jgi:CMP-N-acetylneuraminic acid synthetase
MHIGVIPARKGSKRFPGKNRAKLEGQSLFQIQVEKSLQALDGTIINTDDEKIPNDSGIVKFGGNIKTFRRPEELAQDNTRIDDVLLHMVCATNIQKNDIIHLLQPTSPFLSIETIEKAKKIMDFMHHTDSVQSIYKVGNTNHAYSQRIIKDGWMQFAYPEEREECYNSQKKPDHFVFAGYVCFRVSSLLENKSIWGRKSIGIMVEELETFDIDTREDLENAIRFTRTDI